MRRCRYLVLAVLCAQFLSTVESEASNIVTGLGTAVITLQIDGQSTTCLVPMTLTLQTEIPGFVLTQSYGVSFAQGDICGANESAQANHVASDQTPPAHRCYVNSPGGGVGISSSPYSIELEGGRYTISRIDHAACSFDVIRDTMTVTPGAVITFSRDMSLGTRFSLSVRASIPRLS